MSLKLQIRFLVFTLFIISGLLIWLRTLNVQLTYHCFRQEKTYRKLEQEIQVTKSVWLKETNPQKLESLARHFDMSAPKFTQKVSR